MQNYLTPEEVAKHYQVSAQIVRKWCRTGKIKALRLGKLWRIPPAAIEEFTQQHRQEVKEDSKKADGPAVVSC